MSLDEEIKDTFIALVSTDSDRMGLTSEQGNALAEIKIAYYTALLERATILNLGDSTVANAHNNLGNNLYLLDRYQEALNHHQKAVKLSPEDATYQDNLGVILCELGRFAEAVTHLEKAVQLKPEEADYQFDLGRCLKELCHQEEALPHHQKAAELEPENAKYQNNLGVCLVKLDRYEEALQHYQRAVDLKPENAILQNNLGLCLSEIGRYEEALPYLKKAVDIEPEEAIYHGNLGLTLNKLGRFAEAVTHLEKAVQLKPEEADFYRDLGWALNMRAQGNDHLTALGHINKATELDPDIPNTYGHRADSQRKLAEREMNNEESGRLIADALKDITEVYGIVQRKGDSATNGDYNAVVRACYNARRIVGIRSAEAESATQPLCDQAARQAVLQHPLVRQGIQAGKLTEQYVLNGFKAVI